MSTRRNLAGGAEDDARLLEAALHLAGLCDRFELAETLGWSLTRLEHALAHLQMHLEVGAVDVLLIGREIQLVVREAVLPPDMLARLSLRGHMRRELSAAEAARVLGLIREHLAGPQASSNSRAAALVDAELIERAVLMLEALPGAEDRIISAHPDMWFALGLCAAPVGSAVPPRPYTPSPTPAVNMRAGFEEEAHILLAVEDRQDAHCGPGDGACAPNELSPRADSHCGTTAQDA